MYVYIRTCIGNYRLTCEKVMSVLRENRDSLIAMLEAFVYDPLISWRLLYTDKVKKNKDPEGEKTKNGEDGTSIVGGSHERRSSAQQRNLETITEYTRTRNTFFPFHSSEQFIPLPCSHPRE